MNASQFFDHWQIVRQDLQRALALLSDDDLAFRPAESYDRSLGDILRHIINLERGWIHYIIRRSLPGWPEDDQPKLKSIESIRTELDHTFQETMNYLDTVDVNDFNRIVQVPEDGTPKLGSILWHVFEQQIHHRGEIFLCLSLLGKKRPQTQRPA
jgi:uncharacterized damage-inducible protein DinB